MSAVRAGPHSGVGSTDLELPSSDTRVYKHITLSKAAANSSELHVLLISDPTTDKASAACDVHVGQLQDPKDYPGLAHFAEHMVFIGNKKYPVENAYDNYLSSHGGSSNAFTDLEHTNYYFDVQLTGNHGPEGDDEDGNEEAMSEESKKDGGEEGGETEQLSTFEGALDRFAHCLIDPLFTPSAVSREVQAVNSEHSKNMQQDMWRSYQLSRNLLAPDHPYAGFGTGNAKSLHAPEIISSKDDDDDAQKDKKESSELSAESSALRDELISFFHKYYRKSLDLYKVVVLCEQPIEEMEEMVRRIFGKLVEKPFADDETKVNKGTGDVEEKPGTDPLDLDSYRPTKILKELFPTLLGHQKVPQRVHVIPVSEAHTLELQFPLREQQTLYLTKPSNYLSHLIGHEGAGSLLSALKAKHYAQDLYADGSSRSLFGWSIFAIHIDLTERGLENVNEVIRMVFAYLDVVRSAGKPEEWIQDELKTVADMRFKFLSKRQPMDYTCSVAGWMQQYPPPHYISGTYKVYEFDPDAIVECWKDIRPDNMLVIVSSPLFDTSDSQNKEGSGDTPSSDMKSDPYYGTQYKMVDITDDDMRKWTGVKLANYPELHLPEKNDMIATNFDIIDSIDGFPVDRPQCIVDSDVCRLWYKPDNVFDMPKVNALFLLRTNHAYYHSPESFILSQLWISALHEKCNEFTYLASMGSLQSEVSASTTGIELTVSGYNHKAHILLEKIIEALVEIPEDEDSWISSELFERLHDKLSKQFSAFLVTQPYQHAIYAVDTCLESIHWSIHDKIAALQKVTRSDLIGFVKSRILWKQCKLEGLVHGNLSSADAVKMSSIILDKLNPFAEMHRLESRIVCLSTLSESMSNPSATYKYQLAEFNESNLNSCVEAIFQIGLVDDHANSVLAVVAHLIREPAYNQLRTEEQLGYIVHSAIKTSSSHIKALLILIQSQSHDPLHVDSRIEEFLIQFRKKLVAMDGAEYQKNIDALVSSFLEKNKNLGEESNKYWHVISNQTYRFTRLQELAEIVKVTTLAQVIRFFDRFIAKSSPHRRKLCVQVFAKQHQEQMGKSDDGDHMITSTTEFKRNQLLFPLGEQVSVECVGDSGSSK